MKVITLLNEKGGVGKTTIATHIAAGFAMRGKRVVLIDTDAQGHATIAFGLEKGPGLYQLLVRNAKWQEVLKGVSPQAYTNSSDSGMLFVLPSNIETRAIPQLVDDVTLFAKRILELKSIVDLVVIDTPPTPSMLHGSAYLATDYMMYPTKCEYWSFDGLVESLGRREGVNQRKKAMGLGEIHTLGILPNMYRAKTVEQSENLRELQDRYGSAVWEPMATRTAWTEATRLMQAVWMVDPGGSATRDIFKVLERIQGVVYGQQTG